MAELKEKEEELATTRLANDGNVQRQPGGPKLEEAQEPDALQRAFLVLEPTALFSEPEME